MGLAGRDFGVISCIGTSPKVGIGLFSLMMGLVSLLGGIRGLMAGFAASEVITFLSAHFLHDSTQLHGWHFANVHRSLDTKPRAMAMAIAKMKMAE